MDLVHHAVIADPDSPKVLIYNCKEDPLHARNVLGDFRELVTYLQGNHQRIWLVPVTKVARRILHWRKENGI